MVVGDRVTLDTPSDVRYNNDDDSGYWWQGNTGHANDVRYDDDDDSSYWWQGDTGHSNDVRCDDDDDCWWQGDTGHSNEQEVDGTGRLLHLDPSGVCCWVSGCMLLCKWLHDVAQ